MLTFLCSTKMYLIYQVIVLLLAILMTKKQHSFQFPLLCLCVVLVIPLPPFIGIRGADCGSNVWVVLAGQYRASAGLLSRWGVGQAGSPVGRPC